MEPNQKVSKPALGYKPFDVFDDKATKSKIYRHLVDINDVISEDDIRNIKVSIADLSHIGSPKEEETHKHTSITPWDVMDAEA